MNSSKNYAYVQLLEEMNEKDHCCAGCDAWGVKLTPSHRIPRSRNLALLSDPRNVDWMCHRCHDLVEIGHYDELICGIEIVDYIMEVDYEFYCLKAFKRVRVLRQAAGDMGIYPAEVDLEFYQKVLNKKLKNGKIKKQYYSDGTPW